MTIGVDGAVSAFRGASQADVSPMQKETLRSFRPFRCGQQLLEVHFDFFGICMASEVQPPRHSFHVSIDHDRRLIERIPQQNVRGFTPDSGESRERFHGFRNLAMKYFDHGFCTVDEVLGLRLKKSRRPNQRF